MKWAIIDFNWMQQNKIQITVNSTIDLTLQCSQCMYICIYISAFHTSYDLGWHGKKLDIQAAIPPMTQVGMGKKMDTLPLHY